MNTIKKLLIYPLALVLFFGLTANECLDGVEDLATIEVPTDIDETFEVKSDETGSFSRTETIELLTPELEEYSDRISDFTAESLSVTVTDNIEGGSANTVGSLTFEFDGTSQEIPFDAQNEFIPTLEGLNLGNVSGLKAYLESVLESGAAGIDDEEVNVIFDAESEGSFDYTVRIVISGIVDAGA